MKDLFLTRHGKYDEETGNLTNWGKKQAWEVASQMLKACEKIDSVYLISSNAPRAVQTSEMIKLCFKLDDFFIEEELNTEKEELSEKQIQHIDTLVTSNEGNDVVIISGHYDTVHSYSEYFLNFYGIINDGIEPETGECFHYNFPSRKYQILPK